jgi:Calcium binding
MPRRTASSDRWPPSKSRIQALIEEAIIDAYDDEEQRTGLFTMLEEHLAVPFDAEILGIRIAVKRIEITDDGQIVAVCARGRLRQRISILDLPLPRPVPDGAEWIEAYRAWARAR